MKKIITTVGTSLIKNALNGSNNNDYLRTKNLPYTFWDRRNSQIESLKKVLKSFIESNLISVSAEIDSINKITTKYKCHCDVFLIATDSILSPLCAEYIQKWFKCNQKNEFVENIYFDFNPNYIVSGLQIKDKLNFEQNGLKNLFQKINLIASNYWGNVVFNITGGYKVLIPYMTIADQINNLPIFYSFKEENDENFELLEIPNIPINVDFDLFDKYWKELNQIAIAGELKKNNKPYKLIEDLDSIIEKDDNNLFLSSLGYVLWENYKSRYFLFYCPDGVMTIIENQRNIKRILCGKFVNKDHRNSKTEIKQNHFVFDDGNNNNRIYYFEDNDRLYIYKTFENEEDAKDYIYKEFDKKEIIYKSKLRRLKLNI